MSGDWSAKLAGFSDLNSNPEKEDAKRSGIKSACITFLIHSTTLQLKIQDPSYLHSLNYRGLVFKKQLE